MKKSSTSDTILRGGDKLRSMGGRVMSDVRKGRGVSLDFFLRHGWAIIFFIVVIIVLMGMRYRTRVYMRQITKLRKELKIAEDHKICEKAEYMSMIRETNMVQRADSFGLGLQFQPRPPYILTVDNPSFTASQSSHNQTDAQTKE